MNFLHFYWIWIFASSSMCLSVDGHIAFDEC